MKKNKKNSFTHVMPVLFLFMTTIIGCDDDPLWSGYADEQLKNNAGYTGTVSLDCSKPSSLGNGYICFNIYGVTAPHYFGYDVNVLTRNTWKNPQIGVVLTLSSGGKGTWQSTGSPQKKILWGVQVNKDGSKPGSPTGWYVNIVNDPQNGNLVDTQFGAAFFTLSSSTWSTGFTK